MKHLHRMSISVFLIAASLMTAAMTSCGGAGDTEAPVTDAATVGETAAVTEAVETRAPHAVPVDSLDFGGEELCQVAFDWQGYQFYFFASEENGDIMNDAIYNRTRAVEDALNIKLVLEMHGDNLGTYVSEIKPVILAGDDVYDLMFNHCIDGISTYASEGYLYNLDNLPYVDMTAEWWNRNQMDVLRLGENTYYAVNDMMVPCPYVIYFS